MQDIQQKQKLRWRSIFRHYWPFMRRYSKWQIITFVSYGIGSLLMSVVIPVIYKNIMDTVTAGTPGQADNLYTLFLSLVAVFMVLNMILRIADYSSIRAQSPAIKDLYDYALEHLQKKSYVFYINAFAGSLVAKVKRFVRAFEVLHDQFMYHIWMQGIALISSVVVLWYYSWKLGLIFLVWLICYSVMVRFLVRYTIPKTLALAQSDTAVTGHLADIITNVLTVKMFGATKREQDNFGKTTQIQDDRRMRAWLQDGFWNSMYQGLMVNIFELGIVAAVLVLWSNQMASAGLLFLVMVYVIKSFNIVWSLSRNVINITTALTDADEMVELLDQKVEVTDPAKPEVIGMEMGYITFADIAYGYGEVGSVFENLTITIPVGEKVALVGHSGAGKTTMVKLLLRFVDVTGGAIMIDGQDVRNVRQDELRRKIAYVPQEPILFHRSLFENIAYGNADATQAEVEEVAKRARAHEFISTLPEGYDTLVGERGVKLSGGERQRVAIARALLKDAPVVVLDEATSSLDSISERYIQTAFDELMAGKTTIVIAHRLSTIQHMDRIIVLEKGAVAEQGTHSELLAQNGIYAELWNSQVGGFIRE